MNCRTTCAASQCERISGSVTAGISDEARRRGRSNPAHEQQCTALREILGYDEDRVTELVIAGALG